MDTNKDKPFNTIETNRKIETYDDAIEFLLEDIPLDNFEVRKRLKAEFQDNLWNKKLCLNEALEKTLNAKIIYNPLLGMNLPF